MTWFGAVARGSSTRARGGLVSLLALALLLGASGSCTTNHDALARQPPAGMSNGGGGSSGAGGFGNTGDVPSQGGRVNPDIEPPGDDVLTIVNGVVDAPSVMLCFARVEASGESGELVGSPMKELRYASSAELAELEGFSFADDALIPWVIVGDFSLVEGLDCTDAVALALEEEAKVTPVDFGEGVADQGFAGESGLGGEGGAPPEPEVLVDPPTLRARPLGAIPPGTVNIGRSILMVLTGCLGGAAYSSRVATAVCGDAYAPWSPTVQPIVVKLSRELGFDKVGLQAVHAAQGVRGTVDVRASGDGGVVSLTFASGVAFGGIEPRPADVRFSPSEVGATLRDFGLEAADDKGVIFEETWTDVFASSRIDRLEGLRTYTAVLLGPNPLLLRTGWWNPSAFALIDNDPTRE